MGLSQQEYLSGLPFALPGDLPDAGIELASVVSPALASKSFYHWRPLGSPPTRSFPKDIQCWFLCSLQGAVWVQAGPGNSSCCFNSLDTQPENLCPGGVNKLNTKGGVLGGPHPACLNLSLTSSPSCFSHLIKPVTLSSNTWIQFLPDFILPLSHQLSVAVCTPVCAQGPSAAKDPPLRVRGPPVLHISKILTPNSPTPSTGLHLFAHPKVMTLLLPW